MQAKLIPIGKSSWHSTFYSTLLDSVLKAKNFKIRINACAALSVPRTCEDYGGVESAQIIRKGIRDALDKIDDALDASLGEFKYREQLVNQVCFLNPLP